MVERKPWHRQPGEPHTPYHYFCLYMEMAPGQRSLAKLSKQINRSTGTLEKASCKFKWQTRVQAWDLEISRRLADSHGDAVVKMRERHIQLGIGMQTAVVKELQALVAKIEAAVEKAKNKAILEGRDPARAFHEPLLSVQDIVRLSQHGVELERLTRGLHTIHEQVSGDLEALRGKLSIEQLHALKEINAALKP